jgi:hypothetical protein
MSEEGVGYKKPPKTSQFKAGSSGNPNGRPKRQAVPLAEIISGALTTLVQHRERARTISTTLHELGIKAVVDRAVKGNLEAAELLLKVRTHAQRYGDVGVDELRITDWLPAYRGQTAEQKTSEFAVTGEASPVEWWQQPDTQADTAEE